MNFPAAKLLKLLGLCAGWAAALLSGCRARCETATQAARFVDSVGVNVHLHYQDTAYADFPKVERALRGLGVRHVRDGLVDSQWPPYYSALNALREDGIHALLIAAPGQTAEFLTAFPKRVPGAMEGFEAPNELDAGGGDWTGRISGSLNAIAPAARAWHLPVVGPSLTQRTSFEQLRGRPLPFDIGNLHNYFGGRNPGTPGWGDDGYGSYDWALRLAYAAWGDKLLMTTETGYVMDPAMQQGIPEDIAARYIVRLLLEQWRHGIQRTYLYELLDTEIPAQHVRDRYGLCRSDFTPKPAYTAVQSLMRLLAEPQGAKGRSDNLDFRIASAAQDVHHLLLEKSNGEFYLAVWIEEPAYDVDRKKALTVAPQRITVTLPSSMQAESLHFDDAGKLNPAGAQLTSAVALNVDDRVTILHLFQPHSGDASARKH